MQVNSEAPEIHDCCPSNKRFLALELVWDQYYLDFFSFILKLATGSSELSNVKSKCRCEKFPTYRIIILTPNVIFNTVYYSVVLIFLFFISYHFFCISSVSLQEQRHHRHDHMLPLVLPDLPVWLRLPWASPQVQLGASQAALTPAEETEDANSWV